MPGIDDNVLDIGPGRAAGATRAGLTGDLYQT